MSDLISKKNNYVIVKKIIKYKTKSGGGSWKIAFADFITSLMCFFMLLWTLNATPSNKLKAVASYFRPSSGFLGGSGDSYDVENKFDNDADKAPTSSANNYDFIYGAPEMGPDFNKPKNRTFAHVEEVKEKKIENLRIALLKAINYDPILKKYQDNIRIENHKFELEVTVADSETLAIFEENEGQLTDAGQAIVSRLSKLIKYSSNYLGLTLYMSDNLIDNTEDLTKANKAMGSTKLPANNQNIKNKWDIISNRTKKVLFVLDKNGLDMEKIIKIDNYVGFIPNKNTPNSPDLKNKIIFHLLDEKNDITRLNDEE